jgi:hypothetical protein
MRELFRVKDAAIYLGISESTLAKMRVHGTGPEFAKIGRTVVYPLAALRDFVSRHTRSSTSTRP